MHSGEPETPAGAHARSIGRAELRRRKPIGLRPKRPMKGREFPNTILLCWASLIGHCIDRFSDCRANSGIVVFGGHL